MDDRRIRSVVIVGGGTAGWMTAAALARRLDTRNVAITLVESEAIGTVGVGEATIPPIVQFNRDLGIDEIAFIRETHATFKLGIEFVDWRRIGHRYLHPFGLFGADMNEIAFTHFWLRWVAQGGDLDPERFNTEALAARAGRFAHHAPTGQGRGPKLNYAFQFDAGRYATFLRRFAEALGVTRVEGVVAQVGQDEKGHISQVVLQDGRAVAGDLFVDCSGFRGLLIEQTLGTGYEDWSVWLPANRAVAVPCVRVEDPLPYTRATALAAGWQWRIPLQHRTGNGIVFCDAFLSEDAAAAQLLANLDGEAQAEPRVLKFVTGRRRASWVGNCVAVGLSSGFLEPLESTSIHLIQAAISKLLALFPDRGFAPALAQRFNQEMAELAEGIRDFLIAHYTLTERDDSDFWRHCRALPVPDSLAEKLALFRSRGEVLSSGRNLFKEPNWFAVLYGQGVEPVGWHPLANIGSDAELAANLGQIQRVIDARVAVLPQHAAYLTRCVAGR